MAESFVLPVTNMVQATVLAEPTIEGDADPASDFTIEEAADQLLIDTAPADLSAIAQPPQDRLQMLIEDLSGITGAVRQTMPQDATDAEDPVPPESTAALPASGPRIIAAVAADPAPVLPVQTEPESKAALPAAGPRIIAAAAPDPAPALPVQTEPAAPQIDLLPADPPPAPSPAPREAAVASTTQPPPRIPVASVVRQITDAVVTAREDRVEVALAPEELGRIRMVMTGPDHNPHVLIWAERPEVLDQLRRNATFLQECFGDAGMADASFEFQGDGGTGSDGRQPLPETARHGFDMTEPVSVPIAWTPLAIPARLDIRI